MSMLSVVVPVFNTEWHYLEKCLSSFDDIDSDKFEIVVVDDGSELNYGTKLEKILVNHDYDITLVHKENGGQNSARQSGLSASKYQYVLFLDSDDYIDPHLLNKVLDCLDEHAPTILFYNYEVVDETGKVLESHFRWPEGYQDVDIKDGIIHSDSLCMAIYRKDCISAINYDINQQLRIGEDLAASMIILLSTNSASSLGVCLYKYVKRKTSISRNPPPGSTLDIQRAFELVLDTCEEQARLFRDELEWMAILHILGWGSLRALKKHGNSSEVKKCFFAWMDETFPSWRSNSYLSERKGLYGLWFRFAIAGHWGILSLGLNVRNGVKHLLEKTA